MFNRLSLRQKLTGIIILLVLITLFISGYLSYDLRKKNLGDKFLQNINALADLKVNNILEYVDREKSDIKYISSLPIYQEEQSGDIGTELTNNDEDSNIFSCCLAYLFKSSTLFLLSTLTTV